ncbi:hypothetical protein L6R49_28165 [Myxococcota bacterium]|nr:hypothetical protein [Myxococcota bacterium]
MTALTLWLAWFPDESGCWGIGETEAEARAAAMELRRRDDAPACGWEAWEAQLDMVQLVGLTRVVRAVLKNLRSAEALPWPEVCMTPEERIVGLVQQKQARELGPDDPTVEDLDPDLDLDLDDEGDDPDVLATMEEDLTRAIETRAAEEELREAWRALHALGLSPWAWVGVVAQACDYSSEAPLSESAEEQLLTRLRSLRLLAGTRRPTEWVQRGVYVVLSPVELAPDEELAQVVAQRLTERAGRVCAHHLASPYTPARDQWLAKLDLYQDHATRWHCSRLFAEWTDELMLIAPEHANEGTVSVTALWVRTDAAWLCHEMARAAHDVDDVGIIFNLLRQWGPVVGARWARKLGFRWAVTP